MSVCAILGASCGRSDCKRDGMCHFHDEYDLSCGRTKPHRPHRWGIARWANRCPGVKRRTMLDRLRSIFRREVRRSRFLSRSPCFGSPEHPEGEGRQWVT